MSSHLLHKLKHASYICAFAHAFFIAPTMAQETTIPANITSKKMQILKSFVETTKQKLKNAETLWEEKENASTKASNVLPEGEILFLTVRLPFRVRLEGVIFGQSRNKKTVVSLKDFGQVMNLPINVQAEEQRATGWYLRENKTFDLDINRKTVITDNGEFKLSDETFVEDGDLFVPVIELAEWIDFDIETIISSQELLIKPPEPLPSQAKKLRLAKKNTAQKTPPSSLPDGGFPKQVIDTPALDITANVSYSKNGQNDAAQSKLDGTINSAGDFAYGTLKTRAQYNNIDGIKSIRAQYKQASKEPDLLGALHARRYAIGDITNVNLPLSDSNGQDFGIRITNKDSFNTLTNPTSVISGTTFPGWDVELYRDNQFIALQSVDEEGFFSFDNVNLFNQQNDFLLRFYGPQGEIREEAVSIPVSALVLAQNGKKYDISISLEDEQAYLKNRNNRDQDSGTVNMAALYEQALGKSSAGSVAFRTSQDAGTRNYVGQMGLSTVLADAILNANLAIDDELEKNAEIVIRKTIGAHNMNATSSWVEDNFDDGGNSNDDSQNIEERTGSFQQNISIVGPIPIFKNYRPQYSSSFNYSKSNDGDDSLNASAGINAQWKGLTLNERLNYLTFNTQAEDQLSSLTTLSGTWQKNRIRSAIDYEIKPTNAVRSVTGNVSRKISHNLDIMAEIDKTFTPSLTEGALSMNWSNGHIRVSPRIEYDSEQNLYAGINTRFSALREPHNETIEITDRSLTSTGGISAFVYLDENGNNQFDENESPIENVNIKALQNGGSAKTNQEGVAILKNMTELKRTDVILDEKTLPDPLWISGHEGLSILPREGYIGKTEFPVHIAGEIDGSIFGRTPDNKTITLRNVGLRLYDLNGKLQDTAVTDYGGFYFFSRVPPGTYYLLLSERSAKRDNFARPLPQRITIGYEGTLLFGQNIYVDMNTQDVPSTIVKNYDQFAALNTQVSFDSLNHHLVLNLGEYKSQTLMGLVWFRLRKQFPRTTANTQIYVPPFKSDADPRTGMHTLRVGLNDTNIENAYARCRKLISHNEVCIVEIIPKGQDLMAQR